MESKVARWGAVALTLLAISALAVLATVGIRLQSGNLPAEDPPFFMSADSVQVPAWFPPPAASAEDAEWTVEETSTVNDHRASADDQGRPPASLGKVHRDLGHLDLFPAGEGKLKTTKGELTLVATAPVFLRCEEFTDTAGRVRSESFWDVGYGTYIQVFDRHGKEASCLGPFDRACLTITDLKGEGQEVHITEMLGRTFWVSINAAGVATVRRGESIDADAVKALNPNQSLIKQLRQKPITKSDHYAALH
jgi:hypothetical protein